MKIKILSVEELGGQLRVKVDTPYGIEDLGLSLDRKKLDPITGQPKWILEVKHLLNKKYANAVAPVTGKDLIGTELDTEE